MELSFSKQAKLEALNNYKFSKNKCCNQSFLQGYFFDENLDESTKELVLQIDILKSAKTVKKLLAMFEIDSYVVTKEKLDRKPTNFLYITEENSLESIIALQRGFIHCERCTSLFLLGIFISRGVLSDPTKEYQLEFIINSQEKAEQLIECFKGAGFNFKTTKRRNDFIVYTKQSETVEDFLATIGAQAMCLEIMSNKVVKDIRNKVNRLTNCETANIAKASKASSDHLIAIEMLVSQNKFDSLDDDLKYIANLKIENSELSLTELGNLAQPPMSKSSVNRRMQKLCQMAQKKDK